MQNKKILSTLIVTMLTLSMILAFIPMARAEIVTPTLTPNTGNVGDSVKVNGTGASLGGLVEVFWETTENKLNETYADGTGKYECNVTISAGIVGSHYIIVRDVSTGDTAAAEFTITSEIELTPTSGLPDDSIAVAGTGFNGTKNVTLTFEKTITGEVIDNTTDGTKLDFSGTLEYYPIKNGTLEISATVNAATVTIIDNGTGGLSDTNVTGTITYATGVWVLNFTTNAPDSGTNITANYNIEINITSSPPPETSALGSFDTSFTVPTVPYGSYLVNATDETGNFDTADFNVTATITLTPEEGPTGTVVTMTGEGFTETADLNVTITVDGTTAPQVAPIQTIADGTFTGQFIVPTITTGLKTVEASDGTISATKPFNVTETTAITLDPTAGQWGWEVDIEGLYFTAIADTEVTVKFGPETVKTLSTNSTGGFKDTFTVPGFTEGTWTVNATDANDLYATADFIVAVTLIFLSPTEGPTGANVTITGYGFTKDGTANVTISTLLVKTGISVNATTGRFTSTFIVPTLPAADYTVTAEDSGDLTASKTFTVTKSTELIITPSSAYPGYINATIVGNYFSGNSTVNAVLYNETDSYTLGTYTTLENGTFTGMFDVPNIDIGDYFINATDTYLFPGDLKLIRVLEVPFSIVTVVVQMETRSLEYLQGDTVSFYIQSDLPYNITIEIKDPNDYPYGSISIATGEWVTLDEYSVVPYNKASFTLPSDAALGTWNWTATVGEETATDLFSVVERPTLSVILERLDELDAKLVSLDGTVATISSSVGEIQVSIDAIHLKVVAIDGTVATIETDLGTMQGTVTSIDGNVATIQTDVGVVKADVSDVATDVSDIAEKGVTVDLTPVWIAVVLSLIAAIAACYAVATIHRKLA